MLAVVVAPLPYPESNDWHWDSGRFNRRGSKICIGLECIVSVSILFLNIHIFGELVPT